MLKDDAVLGIWPIAADSLDTYGDVLLAVFNNVVVAAYDISDYTRGEDNKVTFAGQDSPSWAHLVGQPNPGKHWGRQGDAWPVRTCRAPPDRACRLVQRRRGP
jgi:hypothetical protein